MRRLWVWIVLAGCDSNPGANPTDAGSPDPPDARRPADEGPPPSLLDEVDELFAERCTACHFSGVALGGLALDRLGEATIGVPSTQAPMLLVDPGRCATSYLYRKLEGTQVDAGGSGDVMPQGGLRLTGPELDRVCAWIESLPRDVLPERCAVPGDEDEDGQADCADSDCAGAPPCLPEACSGGVDEDGDGQIDCADTECRAQPICQAEDCASPGDEDADGANDCADPDCADHPTCTGENCGNAEDDDQDGRTDCDDDDCADARTCQPEVCGNTEDDDGDGLVDCADDACADLRECQPEICVGEVDENGDGLIDCEDPPVPRASRAAARSCAPMGPTTMPMGGSTAPIPTVGVKSFVAWSCATTRSTTTGMPGSTAPTTTAWGRRPAGRKTASIGAMTMGTP